MSKNQLHALLAVEQDRRNRATEILNEATVLFTKKEEHLDGVTKVFEPKSTDVDPVAPEIKEVVTSVAEKVAYAVPFLAQAIDAQLSKEETNCSGTAKAELIVGDEDGNRVSFGEFSATSLLALEQHFTRLLGLYRAIPTLDNVRQWHKDPNVEHLYYSEEIRFRTQKVEEIIVPVPATKEHPAQIAKVTKDVQIGTNRTTYRSGRITSAEKSELLRRVDKVLDGIKRARAHANQAEVVQIKKGKQLLDFVNRDIL